MNASAYCHAVPVFSTLLRHICFFLPFAHPAFAAIQFEDVSAATGMQGYTETWGGTWGDINGDNWPDLINQGHREYPRIFRNNGLGGFDDIAYELDPGNWIAFPFDDKHGVSLADFDNDGDQDILISVSATGNAQFLVNDGGIYTDQAALAGLEEDEAARLGVWVDFNHDGHLDVVQGYTKNAFFRQRDPLDAAHPEIDFDDVGESALADCAGKFNYGHLIDLNGSGPLEILCMQEGVFPVAAFDHADFPFNDVTSLLPALSNVNDSAVADFNGDQRMDLFFTRGAMRPSGATLLGNNRIEAWLRKDDEVPPGKGFQFESDGGITVAIDHKGMRLLESSKIFEMSPDGLDRVVITREDEDDDGNPIEWDSMVVEWVDAENVWRVTIVDVVKSFQAYVQIDTAQPITHLVENALDFPELPVAPVVLEGGPGGMVQNTPPGLTDPISCVSVVSGDFDNDMDQDLYLVCRRGPDNLPNRLYENLGDGTFREVLGHGAEGPVGTGFSIGVGESVVKADYDVDGFLDLYLTNGLLYYPVNEGGPENLLRNLGNDNHWIELDLVGTVSNRDGVGARVYVTAGGVTQYFEQNGNYHRWSQNDPRLHVGLGSNTEAEVRIEWPSGTIDTHTAVAADALYEATEGGAMAAAVLGPPVYTALEPGDECGTPPYHYDYGPVVLLYKDCASGLWSLRAKGGRVSGQQLRSEGSIVADAPFSDLAPFGLDGGDVLDDSEENTVLFSIGTWFTNDKGFDFRTDGQSTACFEFSTQEIPTLIVGGSRKKITTNIDLLTLRPCGEPPPPPDLDACGDPMADNQTEHGLFVWRDCEFASTTEARWNFSMSAGGTAFDSYPGLVDGTRAVLSAVGADLESHDTLDTQPGDTHIDFDLRVGGSGIDHFSVDVPLDSQTCLITDTLPAGTPVLLGAERSPLPASFNLVTLAADDCTHGCHP